MIHKNKLTFFDKFINKHYVKVMVLSTIVTLVGFALAINAEVRNQEVHRMEADGIDTLEELREIVKAKNDASSFGFLGLLMLFVGFLTIGPLQAYVQFHSNGKRITK